MNLDIPFYDCLKLWKDVESSGAGTEIEKQRHLLSEEIYKMAEPGGIEKCSEEAIHHLSLCPSCLSQWAEWQKAIRAVTDLEQVETTESSFMSFGLLKAAATDGPKGPLSLRSICGKFILNLLPQLDDPEKGMITLEISSSEEKLLEGRHITLRDAEGIIFLDGKIRNGRLARLSENVSNINLNTWTIILSED